MLFRVHGLLPLLPFALLTAQPPRREPAPTLVVSITIDQLRPEYLTLYGSQFTGGLARLLRGGAVFTNAFQDHAITETAPGHASILSGRFPRSTGIVANNAGVFDAQAPLIAGGRGEPASPFRFRGTALIDWMRYANPASRALSVSRKDRGAILPLGRAKHPVFWYGLNGIFTTSTYYADTLPTWVQRFNAQRIPHKFAGNNWSLLLAATQYAEPDSVPVESGGRDFTFPHVLPADSLRTAAAFIAVPMMDQFTLNFALQGVKELALGTGPAADLLAISLSTTDAVGHRYGPDSRELHDQIVRLDRYLGAFLDSLYALRDSARIVIALTSDHGVTPLPEATSRYRRQVVDRVNLGPVMAELRQRLSAAGIDADAATFDEAMLVLRPSAFVGSRVKLDSVARDFVRRASAVEGVQRVDLVKDLASKDTTRDFIARRWYHMLPADHYAVAVVTLKPAWYWDGVDFATHGSPHDADARVPIIFYGAGIRPGTYSEFTRVPDIAPTLADVLDIRPLERLDGHVLRAARQR